MNATNEYAFIKRIASMSTVELDEAICMGKYKEPYLSIAKEHLAVRRIQGAEDRHQRQIWIHAVNAFIAVVALIVAVLAYIDKV